jgi:hypothetical protein
MSIISYAQQVCSVLDELALPRALVNSQLDRFVAWNPHFLNVLNIRAEEISTWQQARLFISKEAASSSVIDSG